MKIKSLIKENDRLIPVEVELVLLPGLPQIHFLGLPDQVIKESLHRIKSSIKNQGFEFPRSKQVIVNLRPNYLKKSSRGIEFAVASGILWETGQLPMPMEQNNYFVYGELGLDGEVYEPEDLTQLFSDPQAVVLTGQGPTVAPFSRHKVKELKDLNLPEFVMADKDFYESIRPEFGLDYYYPECLARIMEIAAVGEHHLLLAGKSGSGKSTAALAIASLLAPPKDDDFRNNFVLKNWRPVIHPHHSATVISMIGGGVPLRAGQITRAHRGILIMDELFEFHPQVQESLREPIEEGVIRMSRGTHAKELQAQFMLVATTNLCPCGDRIPRQKASCQYSRLRCDSTLQKLSGPFVDRFEIVHFVSHTKTNVKMISGQQILERVQRAQEFKTKVNSIDDEKLFLKVEQFVAEKQSSRRRKRALIKVAKSIAALEQSVAITDQHLREAYLIGWESVELLRS